MDTYGCGCFHDCKYCYAKSLLEFRGLWQPDDPAVADIRKIEGKIKTIAKGSVVRLGGMTDCFQPCEARYKVTYKTIQLLNRYGIHYLIVTKSDMIASDEYMRILSKELAHIQITVTATDDKIAMSYEKAVPSSRRIRAIETLAACGFDVAIRVSPFIPEYIDFDVLNRVKCKKAIVEFLRVNGFIMRTFRLDYSRYTHREGGYYHLPLETKKQLLQKINGFEQLSICEDCDEAYRYWKTNVNFNPGDCCNLTFHDKKAKHIGDLRILNKHKTVFLSSRKTCPETAEKIREWVGSIGDECVVSGFQSQNEKMLLNVLLAENKNIVMVLSKELYDKCPAKYEKAVNDGKMLILSPSDDVLKINTKDHAKERNRFVIDMSDEIVVGDVSAGGMLDDLLKEKSYRLLGKKL